jgi:hypothetical protein
VADILAFPTPSPKDGGRVIATAAFVASVQHRALHEREKFRSRRERLGLATPRADDLTMRHADTEDTAPAEYSAPAHDGA